MLCVLQEGSYLPSWDSEKLVTLKSNFPDPGKADKIHNIQMGASCYSLMKNSEGKLDIADVMLLTMTDKTEIVGGMAGSILVAPNTMESLGEHPPAIVSGFMIGPPVAMIPKMAEPDNEVTEKKKKAVVSVNEMMMKVGDEEVKMIMSKHISCDVLKMPVDFIIEVGADEQLYTVGEGKADLMKVLSCDGVEVSLILAKSFIPKKTVNRAKFLMVATSPKMNDGEAMHLLSSMPQVGGQSDLLKPGLLGLQYGAKDLSKVPWGSERDVVMNMLGPVIEFAIHLNQVITSFQWQKPVINSFPKELCLVTKRLDKLYQARKGEDFSELLSCVKTRMTYEDGVPTPSGLLLDLVEDEADGGKHGKSIPCSGLRSEHGSPIKRGKKRAHPSPASSSKSSESKRSAPADEDVGSDQEGLFAEGTGSGSGSGSDED